MKLASVAQAEAALEREQVNLDYTSIHAPIDGVVISRDVDVGQTVAASLQAPTLFTIANDLTRMQVEADVDEAFIGEVKEGQPVSFTVFAYPRRRFSGSVAQVRLQPKIEAGVVKYNCIIHVDNTDLALKPGMTATVSIEVAHRDDVLTVPAAALRYVPPWPQEELEQVRAGPQTRPGHRLARGRRYTCAAHGYHRHHRREGHRGQRYRPQRRHDRCRTAQARGRQAQAALRSEPVLISMTAPLLQIQRPAQGLCAGRGDHPGAARHRPDG